MSGINLTSQGDSIKASPAAQSNCMGGVAIKRVTFNPTTRYTYTNAGDKQGFAANDIVCTFTDADVFPCQIFLVPDGTAFPSQSAATSHYPRPLYITVVNNRTDGKTVFSATCEVDQLYVFPKYIPADGLQLSSVGIVATCPAASEGTLEPCLSPTVFALLD